MNRSPFQIESLSAWSVEACKTEMPMPPTISRRWHNERGVPQVLREVTPVEQV
nr:hypothetical protein [Ktedonospora formicarum]